jgi:hypothetical protein
MGGHCRLGDALIEASRGVRLEAEVATQTLSLPASVTKLSRLAAWAIVAPTKAP